MTSAPTLKATFRLWKSKLPRLLDPVAVQFERTVLSTITESSMSQPQLNRRLTSMDSSFLYFEKKEATMHIGSVSLFEGEIPFEDFVAMMDSNMHLLPRYQQIVVPDPFSLGHPTWEDDPHFNIRNHIFKL